MKEIIISNKRQLLFLCFYFLVACLIVYIFRPIYFYSILIVLVPPSLINFLWLKHSKAKIFYFSLIATILFAVPIELAMRYVDAWDVQTVFARPFGLIPFENILFAFLNFFWVLCFYEHFVDKDRRERLSRNYKYLILLFSALSLYIYFAYFFAREFLELNYASVSVIILVIPAILIFWQKPGLFKKTLVPTIFFALVFFIYEIVSLSIGSWWWPGTYVYSMTINGKILPLDDVFIWYFLSTITLIGGYEYFVDNDK